MDIAARSLKIKRTTIGRLMEEGLYPYTKRYLGSFDNHFSTIGLVGMNEAGLNANWLRKDLTHEETQDFAVRVLKHMRERLSDYQEQYGDLYNLEATPAESTSYRLAKHDKAQYPNIITAHEGGTPYYTNSSHLPVGYTEDVFAALDVQDKLQTLYTSGTVFHTFLGEKLPIGGQRRRWSARLRRTTNCRTIRCLPPIPSAPTMAIWPESSSPVPSADGKRRFTAASPATTAGAELERRQESGVSGQKNLSGERCGAAPCSRSGGRSERDRARFGESRPLYALCHGHLPQLPGGEAAAAKGGRSL